MRHLPALIVLFAAGAAGAQGAPSRYALALQCAAALQITALAAPRWAQEPASVAAINRWLAEAFEAAQAEGAPQETVADAVRAEMDAQLARDGDAPERISARAFSCASDLPRR
jgi:hypothetical protein